MEKVIKHITDLLKITMYMLFLDNPPWAEARTTDEFPKNTETY